MTIDEKWGLAIARAKLLLIQYELLAESSEKYTYTSAISYLKNYLYLAEAWKRKSPVVIDLLLEIIYDEDKWRDKIPYGPKRGKAGHEMR
jgi:hypothetical protein